MAGSSSGLINGLVGRIFREMVAFNIHNAKSQLSKLIRRARAGQEVIISDAGIPVAKLVPIAGRKAKRRLGTDRGKIWVAANAFEPLTSDDLGSGTT